MTSNSKLLNPFLLFAFFMITAAGHAGPPPASLILHAPLETDESSSVGPAPSSSEKSLFSFEKDQERSFLRLAKQTKEKDSRTALAWPGKSLISNAQGTVSFWFKADKPDPLGKSSSARLELAGTGGGEWTLTAKTLPYQPTKNLGSEEAKSAAEAAMKASMDESGFKMAGAEKGPAVEEMSETRLEDSPVETLVVEIRMKLFAEGGPSSGVKAALDSSKGGAWHHILWTWRAGHHSLWIDGKMRCSDGPEKTISRLQPGIGEQAEIKLMPGGAGISDLRISGRFTDPATAAEAAKLKSSEYAPDPPAFRVWADWAPLTGRTVAYSDVSGLDDATEVRLDCVDIKSGKVLASRLMRQLPSRLGEALLKITDDGSAMQPGEYRLDAAALDSSGKEFGRASSETFKVPEMDWPWLRFTGGDRAHRKIKILPPFTPLAVKGGNTVSTVLWDFVLDRSGLPKSISSAKAGGEILESTVVLEATSDGKTLEFSGGSGLGAVESNEDTASWKSELSSPEGHRMTVDALMEYDGMTRFDLTITPKEVLKLDRTILRIPYRSEVVRLAHASLWLWFLAIEKDEAGKYRCDTIQWCTLKPETKRAPGVLFNSDDVFTAAYLNDTPTRNRFAPYMHIGNYERGLSWFAENDKGWIHDLGKVPSMEFIAEGKDTFLRLNLVAKPVEIKEPLMIRFYLMPNPMKPLPPNWRTWVLGDYGQIQNEVSRNSKFRFWWHWGEYADAFKPYPGAGDPDRPEAAVQKSKGLHKLANELTYKDWLGKFKDSLKKDPPIRHIPFINYGTPGGFPCWDQQTMETPFTWKLHNNAPVRNYIAYWGDRCFKEIGILGYYIDEPYAQNYSYNVLASDAPYIRDDGTREIGYQYLDGREYVRRIKQTFCDLGADYPVWLHTTSYRNYAAYSFADISMDGEHPSIWVPEFDNYHYFYNPRYSRGYLAGQNMGLVGFQMFHGNTNPKMSDPDFFAKVHRKTRTFLATTLPCGVVPNPPSILMDYNRIQNLNYFAGISDDGVEDLSTHNQEAWLPGIIFKPKPLAIGGIRSPGKKRALLYVGAPEEKEFAGRTAIEMDGSFAKLGLGGKFVHAWNAEDGVSLPAGGKMVFEAAPQDFAALLLEGRDYPQAPRPDGCILGVSFDKGMEPDFGAGMMPPEISKAGTAATADGKDGKAFGAEPGGGAVGYPVVPSWFAGTAEFDLKPEITGKEQLRLVKLDHHLGTSLLLAQEKGKDGLVLELCETRITEKPVTVNADENPKGPVERHFFALPDGAKGSWHHVVLSWRAGQYDLYLDGKSLGQIHNPSAPRLRDDRAPAMGVIVGDDGKPGQIKALIDSLLVYDWPFGKEDAMAADQRQAMKPAPRPVPANDMSIFYSLKNMENLMVSAYMRNAPEFWKGNKTRFTVTDKANHSKPLAATDVETWHGTAFRGLFLANTSALKPETDMGLKGEGMDDLDLGGGKKSGGSSASSIWILKVELIKTEQDPATKQHKETVLITKEEEISVNPVDLDED